MADSPLTIYLIGQAHLDPVWQWRWTEGCTEMRSTCRAALDFLAQDPALKFSRSSAGELRWLERCEPALLTRIAAAVRGGQWESVGWWTQPDCNIPNGESFVRQALYARAWFRRVLGTEARVGYNVDSFGHHANLPQILQKCGMPYYVFMRPGRLENPNIPQGYFLWEGVDGTRIPAFHIFDPYNASECWGLKKLSLPQALAYLEEGRTRSTMLFLGVGDHGGGPTRATLALVEELQQQDGMPALRFATPSEAFAALETEGAELPLFHGEMQIHAVGCYAANSEIKRLNRRAEEALLAAERLSVLAATLADAGYPTAALYEAWGDTLFNQFHDILAGTSVRSAYTDARDQYGRAIFHAEEAINTAQQALAAHIDTRGSGQAVLLFNPHPFPVRGYYETEVIYSAAFHLGIDILRAALFSPDGTPIPTQHVQAPAYTGDSTGLLFPIALPPLGYQLLRMGEADAPPAPGPFTVNEHLLANERLTVSVADGGVSVADAGRTVIDGLQLLVVDDAGDTWGHDFERYDQIAGAMTLERVRVLEEGPLRAGLRLAYRYASSRVWLDLYLHAGERSIEIRGKACWLEKNRLLKLTIPVPGARATSMQEIPYAALERVNDGREWPIQQWADLAAAGHGVTVLNQGKYSMSVQGDALRPTLLRAAPYTWIKCTAYPWAGENIDWQEEDWMMDQGIEEFRLKLLLHDGDWRQAGVPEAARLFNRPPALLLESSHDGALPAQLGFLSVTDGVRIEVLKRAEDGRGIILRAVESVGAPATARFTLHTPALAWEAAFTPWEIKTFRLTDEGAREELMLEE